MQVHTPAFGLYPPTVLTELRRDVCVKNNVPSRPPESLDSSLALRRRFWRRKVISHSLVRLWANTIGPSRESTSLFSIFAFNYIMWNRHQQTFVLGGIHGPVRAPCGRRAVFYPPTSPSSVSDSALMGILKSYFGCRYRVPVNAGSKTAASCEAEFVPIGPIRTRAPLFLFARLPVGKTSCPFCRQTVIFGVD